MAVFPFLLPDCTLHSFLNPCVDLHTLTGFYRHNHERITFGMPFSKWCGMNCYLSRFLRYSLMFESTFIKFESDFMNVRIVCLFENIIRFETDNYPIYKERDEHCTFKVSNVGTYLLKKLKRHPKTKTSSSCHGISSVLPITSLKFCKDPTT